MRICLIVGIIFLLLIIIVPIGEPSQSTQPLTLPKLDRPLTKIHQLSMHASTSHTLHNEFGRGVTVVQQERGTLWQDGMGFLQKCDSATAQTARNRPRRGARCPPEALSLSLSHNPSRAEAM